MTKRMFPSAYSKRVGDAFVRVDACLTDALNYLSPVTHQSPFASRIADGVPVQYQIMLNELEQVRAAMRTIVGRHNISLPAPALSAIESCRLRISEAMLAVSELDPRMSANSGQAIESVLTDEMEADASRLVGHLMALLDELQIYLSKETSEKSEEVAQLQNPGRSQQSAAPGGAIRHPLLDELERVTVSHGLGDLHRRCIDFARHYTSTDVVVGLYGAVSSGKSTLLNSLLGSALLPVAALPTTAVPVEVRHGRVERGTVEFVTAQTELIDRARVPEFVDEHSNPANSKGVTRIVLETPAPLLAGGITLIDTPGVDWEVWDMTQGNPPTAPWCDVAVVLISATAPLTLREAALVRQLCSRGARVSVLVTKIDLVGTDDRWRIYDHVVRGLWKSTNVEVPVYLVSTHEEDPPWRRAWIDGPFSEALARCREQQVEMRQRQLATLRRDALDALQIRLLWHSPTAQSVEQLNDALQRLMANREAINATTCSPTDPADLVGRTVACLVREVAHNAAALWSETHDRSFDVTRLIELTANAHALSLSGAATRTVETLHAKASVALHHMADTLGVTRLLPALPASFVAPAFVLHDTLSPTELPRSLGWVFGRWGFYLSARRNLQNCSSIQMVKRALYSYIELLEAWKQRSLTGLSQALSEHIERLQAAQHNTGDSAMQATIQRLHDDIARLQSIELRGSSGSETPL